MRKNRLLGIALAASMSCAAMAACSAPSSNSSSGSDAAKATSAADMGGMSKLVAAAKKEGELNVIALPPTWANYGNIIKAFEKKYGIKVNSAQPDSASQDEINAANQLKGRSTAPDVFDLSQAVALANTTLFAPYKVAKFNDIPSQFKDPKGTWVNDYGGYMSVGYDSSKVPAVTSLNDLLKPAYKGKVALNGDPTTSGSGFNGVMMATVANGGTPNNVAPGVNYFVKLKNAGNLVPIDVTPTTIESGQTPVVIDWDYLNAAELSKVKNWKIFVPNNALIAGYYFQAINKDGPHPAAARLWEEFLYSDQGQNMWLAGGARPIRAAAMVKAGTINQSMYSALPKVTGKPIIPTNAQSAKAADYLSKNWSKVSG